MDEVERSVVQHQLDLDRIDNTELQGTIEDVLNDILVIGSLSRLYPLRRSPLLTEQFSGSHGS